MNKKKLVSLCLVLALVLTAVIGGTMAYFTDTDSAKNVMTTGNVKIVQHEKQRANDVDYKNGGELASQDAVTLVDFEQNQLLFPTTFTKASDYSAKIPDEEQFWWGDYVTADVEGKGSSNGLWDDNLTGAIDKFVFVENTGSLPAYYRTIIALECPEGMDYSDNSDKEFMNNVNLNNRFDWSEEIYVTIKGTRYMVLVATYNKVLEPETISRPSLLQVVMTHNATNEDMDLIGSTYDILVLSQATQAAGFSSAATALDTAFAPVTAEKIVEWLTPVAEKVVQ